MPGDSGQSTLSGPNYPGQSVLSGPRNSGETVLGGPGVAGENLPGGQAVPHGQAVPQGPGAPRIQGAPGQAVATPNGPSPYDQDQAEVPHPTAPVVPITPVERPNLWVPAAVAKLQALDKVNAQAKELTVKVGQTTSFGSLTIAVKSCMIRPPDQPADAAAYLDITDSHPDQPGFGGWMLRDEPATSMLQHPIYDLRVTGCT